MKPLRRVLIVQPYGIGDLLFVTPILRALRLLPGIEKVDLLLGSRTSAVVSSNPHVDEIFPVDKDLFHRRGGRENLRDLIRLGRTLRQNRYDLLLDFSLRGEYAFFSRFFLGIPLRAGFDYKRRGFFHNRRLSLPEGFAGRHAADFFCDLAERAGIPVDDRHLEFYPSAEGRGSAERALAGFTPKLERYLVVSPGGGESWGKDACFKRWPPHFFAGFLNRLNEIMAVDGVVIVGSGGEKSLAAELQRGLRMPSIDLAGEIALPAAAALIERAVLFVGNDGGLVHLAHALRIPLIAFYGPVDPAVYGPFPAAPDAAVIYKEGLDCRPCYREFRYNAACVGRECLQDLTAEEALERLAVMDFFKPAVRPA